MKVPILRIRLSEWKPGELDHWDGITDTVREMEGAAGHNDAFEEACSALRSMFRQGRFKTLKSLLKRRVGARALTWLWRTDTQSVILDTDLLDVLVDLHQPRLSRLSLLQLLHLHFEFFDRLDELSGNRSVGFLDSLQNHLILQLKKLSVSHPGNDYDTLPLLKKNADWLLSRDGPHELVRRGKAAGLELADISNSTGLEGFMEGRFGMLCKAHYYLDTLKELPPGEHSEIFNELLSPSISRAPFDNSKSIGQVALEILIDRSEAKPGQAWEDFILDLAGDPRVAGRSEQYRLWWKPIGQHRIDKVVGWLSREDLSLFLKAVEHYGKETDNLSLQRMFPERKRFLEGLLDMGVVRKTRLFLGKSALWSVRGILGGNLKSEFARLEGPLSDKALIYLDCGNFHMLEGSHSFRVWVYLLPPGDLLTDYSKKSFTHNDLIHRIPGQYKKLHRGLPHLAVTHSGLWQGKVIHFLAENGISLNIEDLLYPTAYQNFINNVGIPVVSPYLTAERYQKRLSGQR